VRLLQPMVLAIAATFCASGLVLYFQFGALTALHEQRRVILKQVSQQVATEVARQLRTEINGPVIDTINAIDPPQLREPGLKWLAAHFRPALERYPHIDRFIVWNARTEAIAPGEVLMYGRNRPASSASAHLDETTSGFFADPPVGRAVFALLQKYAPAKKINVVAEHVGPESAFGVFLRLAFTDSSREECFAVLGYIVKPEMLRGPLVTKVRRDGVDALLKERGTDTPLEMRITDAQGDVVYGRREAAPDAARVEFPMLFYPLAGSSQNASNVEPDPWTIEVNARVDDSGLGALLVEFWPTVASVLLMLVALGLTLTAHRQSSELTRMQADFISNASHQLKTPLSLLSAATETVALERVRTPEKLSQYLGIIRGEVARLSMLVQRILEFSRLQQPRRYEFETVDLSALVRETVEAFEGSLSVRQFKFLVEEGEPSPHVEADPAAIEQVLVNLLDNAVKYSGDVREVKVRVGARPKEAVIEVADRGLGIERADLRHIFDKFYRGRHASLNREGFGLGLPIVQELVVAHHGRVEVESEPGVGSTFRVILPIEEGWPEALPSTS
jgi:signal transduction histidine kinase